MDEIQPIIPLPLFFGMELDDKIFYPCDNEGNSIGEPYSYNDWLKMTQDILGVNPDLIGSIDREF